MNIFQNDKQNFSFGCFWHIGNVKWPKKEEYYVQKFSIAHLGGYKYKFD